MLDTAFVPHTRPFQAMTTCDGRVVRELIRAGAAWLEKHHEAVNQLNVFPVPDGDTGTNMLLTIRAAYHAIANDDSASVGAVVDRLAYGALHGSRGNSGTVLSQFFRGFADALRSTASLDAKGLSAAFRAAVQAGYRTFQKPVEGTILTVAREIADEVETTAHKVKDLRLILKRAVARGKRAVARTPEKLPILKQAGVVDSGGQGLVMILEGMLRYLYGMTLDEPLPTTGPVHISARALDAAFALAEEHGEDGFGYDVQYVIRGQRLDVDAIRETISLMGNSPIVLGDSTMVKVHVHVPDPGVAIRYGRSLGTLEDVVIEDMQAQADEYRALRVGPTLLDPTPEALAAAGQFADQRIAVVAIAPGDGLRRLFHDQNAAGVVSGGQTMNPSTGELLEAIVRLDAPQVILLPNNPNIILTAQQAAALAAAHNGKQVHVIPTRTIPQGVSAMLGYLPDGDPAQVIAHMRESMASVRTGEITTATRSLEMDGIRVQAGQLIGLIDDTLAVAGDDVEMVLRALLERMIDADHEMVTLYYGQPVAEAEAAELGERLRDAHPDLSIELIWGGQPHYHFFIGVE